MLLKMRGFMTSAQIGKELGSTGEAARQQLIKLAEDGLVESESQSSGVGRPKQLWRLTAAAQSRFPDTHAALTLQILATLRQTLGENALDQVIAGREAETRTQYLAATQNMADLRARVAELARLRRDEGYMAEWREEEDGSFILAENHCPICAAATFCQGFCRSELAIFREVLGPNADISREEHIPSGGRRCTYRIRNMKADQSGDDFGTRP